MSAPSHGARLMLRQGFRPALKVIVHAPYVWQKQASEAWLRTHEPELLVRFPERIAVIERPGKKRRTLEVYCAHYREAARLTERFGGKFKRISRIQPRIRSRPLKIGDRLLITGCRTGSDSANRRRLVIPAEAAFGTGEHATTAMSLRLMERLTRTWPVGWSLLDAGTGTGILALAGRVFGARSVTGIDNDPVAVATAKRNAIRNRVDGVRFEKADALKIRARHKFDLIAANLFSELLIATIPKWRSQLRSQGILILSGILRSQERGVVRALRKQSIAIEEIRRRGKWIAILARVAQASGLRMI